MSALSDMSAGMNGAAAPMPKSAFVDPETPDDYSGPIDKPELYQAGAIEATKVLDWCGSGRPRHWLRLSCVRTR